MDYGQRIAELRKSKKLTQADLGAKLNVTAQAVSKWENNLSEPDIASIQKMCNIFEVSVNEFLGTKEDSTPPQPKEKTIEQKPLEQPVKIITGYCDKCKKPLGPGECKPSYLSYNPSALVDKVKKSTYQHLYCNKCLNEIQALALTEKKQREERAYNNEVRKSNSNLKKGLLWGLGISIVSAIILFIACFSGPFNSLYLTGAILGTIGAFTLTSCLFWDNFIADFFFFFCRSFRAPFGLIFELSLDGIIWLLTVKLLLWIACGLLSILFFLFGLVLSLALSIICYPFILTYVIKNKTALSNL